MAEGQSMTTAEVVAKTLIDEHADFLRDAVALVAHQLMEAQITAEVGATRGEVSPERNQPALHAQDEADEAGRPRVIRPGVQARRAPHFSSGD